MMQSNLSYSEYKAWAISRIPERVDHSTGPISTNPTIPADDACPPTVRCAESGPVVTSRSKGSV